MTDTNIEETETWVCWCGMSGAAAAGDAEIALQVHEGLVHGGAFT